MRQTFFQLSFCLSGTKDQKRFRSVDVTNDFVTIDVQLVLILPILRILGDGRTGVIFHFGADDVDIVL